MSHQKPLMPYELEILDALFMGRADAIAPRGLIEHKTTNADRLELTLRNMSSGQDRSIADTLALLKEPTFQKGPTRPSGNGSFLGSKRKARRAEAAARKRR